MILGLGTDLVAVARVRSVLEHRGERFARKLLTEAEWRTCRGREDPAQCLAARFAAKEAGVKALGTGFRNGIRFRDLEVYRAPGEPPRLSFHGAAAGRAWQLGVRHTHLSLADEPEYSLATVVLEGTDSGDLTPE